MSIENGKIIFTYIDVLLFRIFFLFMFLFCALSVRVDAVRREAGAQDGGGVVSVW